MEFILGAVVVVFLLALAGVDIWYILLGLIILVALAAAFTAGFIAVCLVMILHGSGKTGSFCGFRRGKRFESAAYLIDGAEYPNLFPAEFILRDRIYKPGKPVRLRLTRGGRVFDANALTTVLAGLPLSAAAAAGFARLSLMLLGAV